MTVKKAYENQKGVYIEFYTNDEFYLGDMLTVDGRQYNSGEHVFEISEIQADLGKCKVVAHYLENISALQDENKSKIAGSLRLKDLTGCYIYKINPKN